MREPWLQVLVGVAFSLTNPRAEDVDFETIATVLARVPRFGGHTENGVLSVAQHCLEGASAIRRDGHGDLAAAAFLIHDAHEYLLGDRATPVAEAQEAEARRIAFKFGISGNLAAQIVKESWSGLKSRLDSAIYPAAGLPWPLDPATSRIVHDYDRRMCGTEHTARLKPLPAPYPYISEAVPVEGCDLWHWSEGTVAKCYMAACRELLPNMGGDAATLVVDSKPAA